MSKKQGGDTVRGGGYLSELLLMVILTIAFIKNYVS